MPDPDRKAERPARKRVSSTEGPGPSVEPMDDEEKILAGRADANLPALLTKDVPGG